MATGASKVTLSEVLLEEGLLTQKQLLAATQLQHERGIELGAALVETGVLTDNDLMLAMGRQSGMEVVDIGALVVPQEAIDAVSSTIASTYQIMPIRFDKGVLVVAMANPMNVNALDDLRFMLNRDVKGVLAAEKQIVDAIEQYYGNQTESLDAVVEDMESDELSRIADGIHKTEDISQVEKLANSAPVIKFLNLVLLTAIKDHASDIHFEPFEDQFRIRYRIDGELLEMQPPPKQLAEPLISRVKVLSKMDIAERRVPQDNNIQLNIRGQEIDLRVSTLPTVGGESVVLRVLDKSNVSLDLEQVGLREDELEYIRGLIDLPNGIILVTGPTGSGKTTTLYSALHAANKPEVKIITTEDPVEYPTDGLIQVPIREDIGVTYSKVLSAILRQDPDKILVGEIRDLETAQIAIEASLTGHVVFSTLHTNDAPSTITRMLDMGLEPFLVAATLECVIAQRLVRKICPKCKTSYFPSEDQVMELGINPEEVAGKEFYYGKRCDHCNKTGYRGRSAIFEIMRIDSKMRDYIIEQRSTDFLRAEAIAAGMKTLREAGVLRIFDGITTIEEVIKETLAFE